MRDDTISPWPEISSRGPGWAIPKNKMPDCPMCEEDELSMINERVIFCNSCCRYFDN